MSLHRKTTLCTSLETGKRLRLACKFLNVKSYELFEVALDRLGIPKVPNGLVINDESNNRIMRYLKVLEEEGVDATGINEYFKRLTDDN